MLLVVLGVFSGLKSSIYLFFAQAFIIVMKKQKTNSRCMQLEMNKYEYQQRSLQR